VDPNIEAESYIEKGCLFKNDSLSSLTILDAIYPLEQPVRGGFSLPASPGKPRRPWRYG
jgi:hypothetical protein